MESGVESGGCYSVDATDRLEAGEIMPAAVIVLRGDRRERRAFCFLSVSPR
jgi:hypothetical protein